MAEYRIPERLQVLGVDIEKSELPYHQKRVAVTKEFTFDAAHHLHAYDGKCTNLHGHTYRLVVTVSGFVNAIGIVIDFGELKQIYRDVIERKVDHQYLNEVLPKMNTTAENMVVWIWEQFEAALAQYDAYRGLRLEQIDLFETPTSKATLKREWMI
ncbi:6-carboxytetrahydropterin synthase QueD [Alicyclobacillus hesperidum subsp. aegles]|uniref:6-carboxytetrahydropterin synthase QueD n=1 Tax=Alicyclobacillus hesperidum TaxID=89784 RepID=UPI00222C45CE|nr:6-carboxytetrahydropterin synthase QueD [Alicyclobacillus hesperidum]GLG00257.1 6-carboxytetrahydropterin synthase QueD [Alicyclobacillus hesperidum subsp. aegles]